MDLGEKVQALAPGLSLSKMLNEIGGELKQQLAAGSHEMAAALFRGDAFVMYPRTNQARVEDGEKMSLESLQAEAAQSPPIEQGMDHGLER